MKFPELVSSLGKELRIANLAAADDGVARVAFDEQYVVSLVPDTSETGVCIYANMGTVKLTSDQLELILAANVDGEGTSGAFFAQHRNGNLILAHYLPLAAVTFAELWASLEAFVNALEYWAELLKAPVARNDPGIDHFTAFLLRA